MTADALQSAVRRLAFGQSLSATDSADAFGVIMSGEATASQVAALLMALRVKGETADEVAGAARALRAAMIPIDAEEREYAGRHVRHRWRRGHDVQHLDGGGAARGRSRRAGSPSTATARSRRGAAAPTCSRRWACRWTRAPPVMSDVLRRAGVVFMFAPTLHPAMRHVGPVRRELGIPTVMNIVGPLANPAGAGRQVVGVADRNRMPLLAGALAALGSTHALVVHGEPGMDEVSPIGPTHVAEIRNGTVTEWVIDPAEARLQRYRGRRSRRRAIRPRTRASLKRCWTERDQPVPRAQCCSTPRQRST